MNPSFTSLYFPFAASVSPWREFRVCVGTLRDYPLTEAGRPVRWRSTRSLAWLLSWRLPRELDPTHLLRLLTRLLSVCADTHTGLTPTSHCQTTSPGQGVSQWPNTMGRQSLVKENSHQSLSGSLRGRGYRMAHWPTTGQHKVMSYLKGYWACQAEIPPIH